MRFRARPPRHRRWDLPNVAGRLSGDFFAYVPEADIYLLKHILHDWNDGEAVRILKRCRHLSAFGQCTAERDQDLPQTLSACGADAVVLDEADTYLSLVPMHLGMPYVSVSNALPFDFSGQAPLCLFDSPFDPSPAGLARNREQLKFAEPVFAPRKAVGRAYAGRSGWKSTGLILSRPYRSWHGLRRCRKSLTSGSRIGLPSFTTQAPFKTVQAGKIQTFHGTG